MRVEPDEKFIAALDHELKMFNYFIERVMKKIGATSELLMPPGGSALRESAALAL